MDPADAVSLSVTQIETSSGSSLGITISTPIPGMVPPYEEAMARRESGYTVEGWRELSCEDRAIEVALYRINNKIEAMSADAQAEASKRASK